MTDDDTDPVARRNAEDGRQVAELADIEAMLEAVADDYAEALHTDPLRTLWFDHNSD